jgi:hypothetical protein
MSDDAIHADPEIAAATPAEPEVVPKRESLEDRRTAALARHQEAVRQAYATHGHSVDRHALGRAIDEADAARNVELRSIAVEYGVNPV